MGISVSNSQINNQYNNIDRITETYKKSFDKKENKISIENKAKSLDFYQAIPANELKNFLSNVEKTVISQLFDTKYNPEKLPDFQKRANPCTYKGKKVDISL